VASSSKFPLRGEIWFAQLPFDPPEKGRRPVVIVSLDARNRHERADTVLAVPLTTSVHKDVPTHVLLTAGETGLQSDSAARAEDVTVVRKANLMEARNRLRKLSDKRICELANRVSIAMGCAP
jgi:mRNA interferase MazF